MSVSKQNCITHCIISELVIEKTNEKCWIYHTFLRVLHHTQNHLRLHRGFYLCLNKSNKIHLILYFLNRIYRKGEVNELLYPKHLVLCLWNICYITYSKYSRWSVWSSFACIYQLLHKGYFAYQMHRLGNMYLNNISFFVKVIFPRKKILILKGL